MPKLWFKAKRYGWGWYPVTIEGWFVLLIYVALFVKEELLFLDYINKSFSKDLVIFHVSFVFLITGILIYICYKKGEPARWRWNGK